MEMSSPHHSRNNSSSSLRRTSRRFDVTATMDRLRSSMVGADAAWKLDAIDEQQVDTISDSPRRFWSRIQAALAQIPAILLIGIFHLMIGIAFGVSYFPVGWRSNVNVALDSTQQQEENGVDGPFPLPGKEALGIRMFLFSTIVGQVVFTLASQFPNPIGLQMVENVPFCHELAYICIKHQGFTKSALSTLFFLFGFASLLVGIVFFVLGRLELGRIVYYFPNHVLVGIIGGIGLFIAKTGVEVTMDDRFSVQNLVRYIHLLAVVLFLGGVLRLLEFMTRDANGKQKYALLSPIYFCSIPPMFYAALWLFRIPLQQARDAGYFFPPLDDNECDAGNDCESTSLAQSIFNDHLLDIWRVLDFSAVSMTALVDSIPTLVALILFSLIHVPINIPAFALSTNTEVDMNTELVAHGYSNFLAGLVGGLQNYMAYTQSVLYDKSGGTGKASGMAVALLTSVLFLVGPAIASFLPRCMAGTLLLHVGIDLFLEGVKDSYGRFDALEYAGIWLITITMTLKGMEAAMIAGFITAVSTYAFQNLTYVNPLRGSMSAVTLRSSRWNRNAKALEVLADSATGRGRILVVQLQGHLFFGNMAQLTSSMSTILSNTQGTIQAPWIVIMDFGLVLGIDSSAAQAMVKLKDTMQSEYNVELCVFVSGSEEGFPTAFDLSSELSTFLTTSKDIEASPNEWTRLLGHGGSCHGSHVCETLDEALIFSENALIARADPSLLEEEHQQVHVASEDELAFQYMTNICPQGTSPSLVQELFSGFVREDYRQNDLVWRQGAPGDCIKLVVRGELIAKLENEAGTSETIASGNTIGELGLVEGVSRMSSVLVLSEEAVLYSLSRNNFEELIREKPHVARLVDLICVRYLSARIQHVSNRIFETRCLPI